MSPQCELQVLQRLGNLKTTKLPWEGKQIDKLCVQTHCSSTLVETDGLCPVLSYYVFTQRHNHSCGWEYPSYTKEDVILSIEVDICFCWHSQICACQTPINQPDLGLLGTWLAPLKVSCPWWWWGAERMSAWCPCWWSLALLPRLWWNFI